MRERMEKRRQRFLKRLTTLMKEAYCTLYLVTTFRLVYRFSPFQQLPGAIVGGLFRLQKGTDIRLQQKEMIQYRTATQPYKIPSAGCIFRNPPLHSAGALIEKMGWKGKKFGGAKVSDKHANFIVNAGEARAEEVHQLIDDIQTQAKHEYGIDLLVEIRRIPYNEEKKR